MEGGNAALDGETGDEQHERNPAEQRFRIARAGKEVRRERGVGQTAGLDEQQRQAEQNQHARDRGHYQILERTFQARVFFINGNQNETG